MKREAPLFAEPLEPLERVRSSEEVMLDVLNSIVPVPPPPSANRPAPCARAPGAG